MKNIYTKPEMADYSINVESGFQTTSTVEDPDTSLPAQGWN